MKRYIINLVLLSIGFMCVLYSCTKEVAKNPELAFGDKALYDSCRYGIGFKYYKNRDSIYQVHPGSNSPHGAFKLKFNVIGYAALTDSGRLPVGKRFPEGSMVVKEVQSNGMYAFMYKHNNAWLWGEVYADGTTAFSVYKDPKAACISCHSQSKQRDYVLSFAFY